MAENISKLLDEDVTTLFVTDGEGNILLANEFTALTLGMAVADLLNSNVFDLVGSGLYNDSATIKTLKTHQASEVNLTTTAGYHIRSKSSPIFYPDGTLHLVVTKSDPLTEEEVERWKTDVKVMNQIDSEEDYGPGVIAESMEMKRLLRVSKQVAKYNSRVLLLGESGVGKEVIASYIHRNSPFAENAYIAVNCAAIPDNLFESEFFGYEAGTFTGAKESKPGLIEAADGGTLFLDEVSEMPIALQAKLLRALETMSIRRVGSLVERPVSFRLISASNEDMMSLVEKGKFRRDLYYRINAIPLEIPALRARKKDIVALSNHFLEQFNQTYKKDVTLSTENMRHLMLSDWPGNVRELKNFIEYTVVTSDLDLPMKQSKTGNSKERMEDTLALLAQESDYPTFMGYVEKVYFKNKLSENDWNISQTAEESKVSRPFIYKKISELELEENNT